MMQEAEMVEDKFLRAYLSCLPPLLSVSRKSNNGGILVSSWSMSRNFKGRERERPLTSQNTTWLDWNLVSSIPRSKLLLNKLTLKILRTLVRLQVVVSLYFYTQLVQ